MDFLGNWWDFIVFGILTLIHIAANIESWQKIKSDLALQNALKTVDQKNLGATILNGSSAAGISAVSILIPASLLIVQIGLGSSKPMPPGVLDNVFRASIWFLISLGAGLIFLWISGAQSQFRNVATNLLLMIFFGPQLIALGVGVVRLVIGIHSAIYH